MGIPLKATPIRQMWTPQPLLCREWETLLDFPLALCKCVLVVGMAEA